MNKTMFYSGLTIMLFQLIAVAIYLIGNIDMGQIKPNITLNYEDFKYILSGTILGLLNIASFILMIVGAIINDKK